MVAFWPSSKANKVLHEQVCILELLGELIFIWLFWDLFSKNSLVFETYTTLVLKRNRLFCGGINMNFRVLKTYFFQKWLKIIYKKETSHFFWIWFQWYLVGAYYVVLTFLWDFQNIGTYGDIHRHRRYLMGEKNTTDYIPSFQIYNNWIPSYKTKQKYVRF